MKALRDGASNGILKYFLLGLLALAGGGLVFTDMGGFFRGGGVSSGDVAKVGDKTISAQQFDRTVRANLRSSQMTPQQAYQLGYVKQLVESEVRSALALQAANEIGFRLGRETLSEKVKETIAPLAQNGQSPKDILTQILASRSISEGQFLAGIEEELKINALNQTLESGFAGASDEMIETLARLNSETRKIEYIVFDDKNGEAGQPPQDELLMKLYEAQKEAFAIPEMRSGQFIIVKMGNLKETIDISDEELRAEYEDNIGAYTYPETRTIEQVLLTSQDEAQKVAEKAKAGSPLKAALKSVTQNTVDFIPGKSFAKDDLPEELQDPAFSAKSGETLGPIETGLGYQVITITDIKEPRVDSYEKVSKTLKEDLLATRLLDAQYEQANMADDLLASGMTAEEISEEIDIEIQEIPLVNRYGYGADKKNALQAYGEDTQTITENLFDYNEGEASPVLELNDGRLGAVLVKTVQAKSYKPFEEVKAELEKRAIADQRRLNNRSTVSALRSEIVLGEKTFNDIEGKKQSLSLKRSQDEPPAPFTPAALGNIFETPVGESVVINLDDSVALVNVLSSDIPEKASEEAFLKAKNDLAVQMRTEVYSLFIKGQNEETPAKINDRLLQQMYGGEAP